MKVEVYRNLNNGMLSIRDAKTKHVVGHADRVTLMDVTFHVSQAGRERVLRERRKNVHAVVRGALVSYMFGDGYKGRSLEDYLSFLANPQFRPIAFGRVRYNPYESGEFRVADAPIHNAEAVRIGVAGIHLGTFEAV